MYCIREGFALESSARFCVFSCYCIGMINEHSYIPALENERLRHHTIEYYKGKSNGPERHAEDALSICLAALTRIKESTFRAYIEDTVQEVTSYPHTLTPRLDPLDIKECVKSGILPNIEESSSISEFTDAVSHINDDSIYRDIGSHVLDSMRVQDEAWGAYVESVRQKSYEGGSVIVYGPQNVLMTRESISAKFVARFNIKTPISISPYEITHVLGEIFEKNETILKNGFQLKSLRGDSCDRDSVIVYATEGSFQEIAKVLEEYFKNNFQYHDRNADKAIFGGVALESGDGSKFPAIRICAEPDSISGTLSSHWTFNDLQATILTQALGYFIEAHFEKSKDTMLNFFVNDYLEGLMLWEKEFPTFYKKAVEDFFGEEVGVSNIAFFQVSQRMT